MSACLCHTSMYITHITLGISITYITPVFLLFSGDSTSVQAESIVTTLWLDNCVVRVMSTNSQPKDTTQVLRRQQSGTRASVPCPTAVAQ